MAGIEGAVIGAAVSLGLGAYSATSGFSARHDQAHDAQVAETRKIVDDFEKLRKSGDMADEDYDVYLERKGIAIQSAKAYRDSISDFKTTGLLNPIKKLKKGKEVRKRKRQVREANQDLHDHYYDSSSCGSDASSIAAESGSPPQAQDIREWADGVSKNDGADDEEDWKDYFVGGYHPVEIGDSFSDGRYVVVRKLGWGRLSTVWLAKDEKMDRHVALKIIKSAQRYTDATPSDIKLLRRLVTSYTPPIVPTFSNPNTIQPPSQSHPGRQHLISFFDHFQHEGPNGIHVCMVFEAFGENLLDLIKRRQNRPLPIPFVKQIAKQIILGLDYMHRFCGVIHTDLKPENIFICIGNVESVISTGLTSIDHPDESSEVAAAKVTVKIAGLRNSTRMEHDMHHLQNYLQTSQYRCPEVILGAKCGSSSNFWSLACVIFELITGDYLFDPSGVRSSKDADHIAQIIELLGDIPKDVVASGKYSRMIFNQRRLSELSRSPLKRLLEDKYSFPRVEANALAAFLEAMLHLDPKKRANASGLTHYNWLEGIFVRSEIDVLRGAVLDQVAKERTLDKDKDCRGSINILPANTPSFVSLRSSLLSEGNNAAQQKDGKPPNSNIKDPISPTKSVSTYFMFLRQIRASPRLVAEIYGDETDAAKQTILAADKWWSMTDAERQSFLAQAEPGYKAARRMYKMQVRDPHARKIQVEQEKGSRATPREAGKSCKSNTPRKRQNAYFVFLRQIPASPHLVSEIFGNETGAIKQRVLAAERWRSMTYVERQCRLSWRR